MFTPVPGAGNQRLSQPNPLNWVEKPWPNPLEWVLNLLAAGEVIDIPEIRNGQRVDPNLP